MCLSMLPVLVAVVCNHLMYTLHFCLQLAFSVCSNRIGRDGAAHLACLLTQDTRLTHLDLSYNRIEDDGAIAISNALTHYNRNLKM